MAEHRKDSEFRSQAIDESITVFFWCSGQDDNIGDVVLRRCLYGQLVRHAMGSIHVYVGKSSDSFIEALGLDSRATLYRSKSAWLRAILCSSQSPLVVFDPGELRLNDSVVPHLALLPMQVLARARGGRSVKLGISIRSDLPTSAVSRLAFRLSGALVSDVVWRDVATARIYAGGRLGCDWAFGDYDERAWAAEAPRNFLAISVRDDKPLWTQAHADTIREFCDQQGLTPIVFVQVRRDNDVASRLAERIGCDLVLWPSHVTHAEQEGIVRQLMRQSVAVLGDRLHALIVGATEGAIPVGLTGIDDTKIGAHLEAIGLFTYTREISSLSPHGLTAFLRSVISKRAQVANAISDANRVVAEMGYAIRGEAGR
ncbi:polysaccharide pyruvyl transferase family protein [Gordonia amicalis]|uniref:Polysaccharide pyruvyl transferase family protein n=1 Tax=Gordonia amicalis TaxID=89053 RepID=A0AAE4UBC0_9ACTN|nr:polysaccharide pyruvyl transferase family protein [Gordonia amicalis]MDV6314523.1 polysaccharide pyruvyl transferase family protein [Gordonia amicalis]